LYSFFVLIKEIDENDFDFNINRYKEIVYETIEYDSPKKISKGLDELGYII